MSAVGIFRPGTAQTGFFSSETSETGFSSSGRAQNGLFSRHSRLLAFLRLRRVFGFSSPVTFKLAFLRTARRYMKIVVSFFNPLPKYGLSVVLPLYNSILHKLAF